MQRIKLEVMGIVTAAGKHPKAAVRDEDTISLFITREME